MVVFLGSSPEPWVPRAGAARVRRIVFRKCRDVAGPAGSLLQKISDDIARGRIAFISSCQKMLLFPVLNRIRRDRVPPGVES